MSALSNADLLLKFRGCMMGALVGDCLGRPFEFNTCGNRQKEKFLSDVLSGKSNETLLHTDDTCMTISVASSIIENKKVDPEDLAKKFVADFFKPGPDRSYGSHVISVFYELRMSDFKDVFLPAKKQFCGSGSYGNGGAMRIAPVALLGWNKTHKEIQMDSDKCSLVTHTHPYGLEGAVLQCLAVHAALALDPREDFCPVNYIAQLATSFTSLSPTADSPYINSLEKIKDLFKNKQDITAQEIAECLGNEVTAQRSVPAAIYSFLRGMNPIDDFECPNPFVRTIYFALLVGGDTDTIASMAGSIAGAYYGVEKIPESLRQCCENTDHMNELAEGLYKVFVDDRATA